MGTNGSWVWRFAKKFVGVEGVFRRGLMAEKRSDNRKVWASNGG
jgi:hypothetical protein